MSDCTFACGCMGQLPNIKQGDDYYIACTIYYNGVAFGVNDLPLLDLLEYCFEDGKPRTIKAADSWSPALGKFLLPVSQEQSFLLDEGKTRLDLRVKFQGGNVLGARHRRSLRVLEANSMEVI